MSDQLFSVENKICIVTGGLGQIGKNFVQELWKRGARVAVWGRTVNDERIAKTLGEEALKTSALRFYSVDITKKEEMNAALDDMEEVWGDAVHQTHTVMKTGTINLERDIRSMTSSNPPPPMKRLHTKKRPPHTPTHAKSSSRKMKENTWNLKKSKINGVCRQRNFSLMQRTHLPARLLRLRF